MTAGVNFTYRLRDDKLTGSRSYMPLQAVKERSVLQLANLTAKQAAKCAPDEWPHKCTSVCEGRNAFKTRSNAADSWLTKTCKSPPTS